MSGGEAHTLRGHAVLITRPAQQAGRLAALIRDAGGEPIVFPAIAILPPADGSRAANLLHSAATFQLAIFISPIAVEQAYALLAAAWPETLATAAIGEATSIALRGHGVQNVIVPNDGSDSEALLARPELTNVAGQRILIVRGEGGRERLAEALRRRGADVVYAECYRRRQPQADPGELLARWERGALHAVTVMSSETLDNFWNMIGPRGQELFGRTPLFMPHASIAEHAADLGLTQTAITPPGDEGMVRGLSAWFALQPQR
ncbi:MAG: uroporphyrinogen-III synthase [Betaproteobacteria bacterium]